MDKSCQFDEKPEPEGLDSLRQYVFLYLHKIVEGLYFHCSSTVCVSVCVSDSACEQNSYLKD